MYPGITSTAFQGLKCLEIDGVSYLKRDLNIECYTSEHWTIIFSLVIPVILIYVVGFPIIIAIIIKKNRKNLDNPDTIIKYGLFYIGFNDSSYYWEIIVNNLRKLVIIGISVAFNQKQGQFTLLAIFSYLYFNH
jgi:hypothetical protein